VAAPITDLSIGRGREVFCLRAAEDHTPNLSPLRCSSLFEKARKDPRFGEVFKKAGLPYRL